MSNYVPDWYHTALQNAWPEEEETPEPVPVPYDFERLPDEQEYMVYSDGWYGVYYWTGTDWSQDHPDAKVFPTATEAIDLAETLSEEDGDINYGATAYRYQS